MEEVEQYKLEMASLTERERAEREADLYVRNLPKGWRSETGRAGIDPWFCSQGVNGAFPRDVIRKLGDAGEPLWALVDRGEMTLSRAAKVATEARRAGGDLAAAVIRCIDEYNAPRGETRVIKDRIIRYRKQPARERKSYTVSAQVDPEPVYVAPVAAPVATGDKAFWQSIKTQVLEHVNANTEIRGRVSDITDDLLADLAASVAMYSNRVRTTKRRAENPVTAHEIATACATLNTEEPEPGCNLEEWLTEAKTNTRRLARLYHPDKHGGDETTRPLYEKAIEAFVLCKRYAEERKSKKKSAKAGPRLVVIDGGHGVKEKT